MHPLTQKTDVGLGSIEKQSLEVLDFGFKVSGLFGADICKKGFLRPLGLDLLALYDHFVLSTNNAPRESEIRNPSPGRLPSTGPRLLVN